MVDKYVGFMDNFDDEVERIHAKIEEYLAAGKKIFLLTNSGYGYTRKILDHILPAGTDRWWRVLFDVVVVDAGKPGFFLSSPGETEFELVDSQPEDGLSVFRAGSAYSLEQHLCVAEKSVLYIGDNPSDDCAAGINHGWSVAMVVPEIGHEGASPAEESSVCTASSPRWGSVFRENGRLTRFGGFVEEIPDLYSAGVRRIIDFCLARFQAVSPQ